jgi:hypothetical protein
VCSSDLKSELYSQAIRRIDRFDHLQEEKGTDGSNIHERHESQLHQNQQPRIFWQRQQMLQRALRSHRRSTREELRSHQMQRLLMKRFAKHLT